MESDYGSSDDRQDVQVLRAYSPFHNIKPGTCYPPTLSSRQTTMIAWYRAHLQVRRGVAGGAGCDNPILIRIENQVRPRRRSSPTTKLIDEAADNLHSW